MIRILLLLLAAMPTLHAVAQDPPPRLVRTAIGGSGCSAYLPQGMPPFDHSLSEDSSDMYVSETMVGAHTFSCIAVKFAVPLTGRSTEELEGLAIGYIDFLASTLDVTEKAGVGRGHRMDAAPDAVGVLDYWRDAEGLDYVVKAWVDPDAMGVLIIIGPGEYPHPGLQQMYLDGFRFNEQ